LAIEDEAYTPRSGCINKKFNVQRCQRAYDIDTAERRGEDNMPPGNVFNYQLGKKVGRPWGSRRREGRSKLVKGWEVQVTFWKDKCNMVQHADDVFCLVQGCFETFDPRFEAVYIFCLLRLRK
jgi:hypothetical protein